MLSKNANTDYISDFADFEINNYRFININDIDDVLREELLDDTVLLGSLPTNFIANCLNLSVESIEFIQKREEYESLGYLLEEIIDLVVEKYIKTYRYVGYFGRVDDIQHEILDYYYFKI